LEPQALPIGTMIKNLFMNPSYILSVFAITNVMFILTALQYWITSYAVNVLEAEQDFVVLTFSAVVITAPCIGAITGGVITTKFLGSYTNKNALVMCFVVYCLFVAFCVPCPLVNSYPIFIGLAWLAIFMQGFIEPIMMGIILNTVTPLERPTASSLAILIEMGVGMLPAPYLYGIVQDKFITLNEHGQNTTRAGMYVVFFSSGIGGVCLLIALLLRRRSYKMGAERMRGTLKKTL
jgi:MFS family permease